MQNNISEKKVKLDPETQERLRTLQGDIEEAKRNLASLEKLGIDVQTFRDKLAWAEKAREILLKEFG